MRIVLSMVMMLFVAVSGTFAQNTEKEAMVLIETEYGNIKIKLYNETPQHRDNFLKLAREGFYDGTLFHRVIKDFMIQGGDPDSKNAKPDQMLGSGGPSYTIPAEMGNGFVHTKGALSAARQGDQVNPDKRSSGSQFYIVHGRTFSPAELDGMASRLNQQKEVTLVQQYLRLPENSALANEWNTFAQARDNASLQKMLTDLLPKAEEKFGKIDRLEYTEEQKEVYSTLGGAPHLDGNYTVFGQVVEGLDVIDKIAAAQTNRADRPLKDISMKVTVL